MKKKSVFIDGSSGTTGLQVVSRLSQRADISLISLPDKEKKLKEIDWTPDVIVAFQNYANNKLTK